MSAAIFLTPEAAAAWADAFIAGAEAVASRLSPTLEEDEPFVRDNDESESG